MICTWPPGKVRQHKEPCTSFVGSHSSSWSTLSKLTPTDGHTFTFVNVFPDLSPWAQTLPNPLSKHTKSPVLHGAPDARYTTLGTLTWCSFRSFSSCAKVTSLTKLARKAPTQLSHHQSIENCCAQMVYRVHQKRDIQP